MNSTTEQLENTFTETIRVTGARTHNLKNIDVEIPRNQLVVITGRSGSGKSSLAFDTIYAEGQRQYIECLSIYSRKFLDQLPRADVDLIEGLQPTLCLDQSHRSSNRRSTVGTVTEIYSYLRLLMARVGDIHCYGCGEPIRQQTPQQIRDQLLELPERTKVMILAPVVVEQPGQHRDAFSKIRRERLVRVRVDGEIHDIDQVPDLNPKQPHSIEAITDRIIIREDIESRLLESIDAAVRISSDGQVICCWLSPESSSGSNDWEEKLFSTRYACPGCDIYYSEVQPRSFSFNSPFGACETCGGLGQFIQFDPSLTVDRSKSLDTGAVTAWLSLTPSAIKKNVASLEPILNEMGFHKTTVLSALDEQQWERFLNSREKGKLGLNLLLEKEFATTANDDRYDDLDNMQSHINCPDCAGSRVSKQARSVLLNGKHMGDIVDLQINEAQLFFEGLELDDDRTAIAEPILNEIIHRLSFLQKVGVDYVSLGRAANTLSGGEHQRIRLATSIGSGLTSVCFVLDEPSIGLHQRDNERLIGAIRDLQESGNTLIVVEHDEAMMMQADHLIDMGPGAGIHGGEIVAQGTPQEVIETPNSLTGQYLAGDRSVGFSSGRRPVDPENQISITGASGNNLQNINVDIPLGVLCCVTGVSGSGKSTLINQTIAPAIRRHLDLLAPPPGTYDSLTGLEKIEQLIVVDQKPIGRTARACPATYSGIFDHLRKIFSATKLAKQRGYGIGRFSYNSKTGWCPECQGLGVRKVAMNFMPDVHVTCETCQGKRFNLQTLQVRFAGLSIADVLGLTIDEAVRFFDGFSKIKSVLQNLSDVGLGYLKLGQSSNTLSGGEAQRVKLATELAKPTYGNTLYLLDEPTTGLHFEDVNALIGVLNRLVDAGSSMIVIEHNLDVIRCADWVIDLGPDGGKNGGQLIGAGTPEQIAELPHSYTGQFLASSL